MLCGCTTNPASTPTAVERNQKENLEIKYLGEYLLEVDSQSREPRIVSSKCGQQLLLEYLCQSVIDIFAHGEVYLFAWNDSYMTAYSYDVRTREPSQLVFAPSHTPYPYSCARLLPYMQGSTITTENGVEWYVPTRSEALSRYRSYMPEDLTGKADEVVEAFDYFCIARMK
jgi:hypothetical protein